MPKLRNELGDRTSSRDVDHSIIDLLHPTKGGKTPGISQQSNKKAWSQFRTRDPNVKRAFLDVGRAEELFGMIVLPDLGRGKELRDLIGAAYTASEGNTAVLDVLIKTFDDWDTVSDAFKEEITSYWNSCKDGPPIVDAVTILRQICTNGPFDNDTRVEAIFDDPSFDFVSYLAWQNSDS